LKSSNTAKLTRPLVLKIHHTSVTARTAIVEPNSIDSRPLFLSESLVGRAREKFSARLGEIGHGVASFQKAVIGKSRFSDDLLTMCQQDLRVPEDEAERKQRRRGRLNECGCAIEGLSSGIEELVTTCGSCLP
jgi:hypothetical protein